MNAIFIHGAGCSSEVFAKQQSVFSNAHFPDLPGRGASAGPASVGVFAEFIEEYAASQGLGDVVLCGHSMGGAIALEIALRGRMGPRGIVLLDSGARLRVAPAIFEDLENDFAGGTRRLGQHFFAAPSPERVEWIAGVMQQTGQAQTLRDFRACDAFDALGRLEEISAPLLSLTGDADRLTPPKFASALAGRVPRAEARIIAAAGHFAMVEQPEETNSSIAAFLTGVS